MQSSSSDLRPFAHAELSRADRLLRAAVSGYCALTRPRKYDAQQLQDLAMPLIGSASRESLRYVAAALSKCETEPPELVRALARMSIDIAAPLLSRSRVLTDPDLIMLIGTHGVGHARAIAKRQNLNPTIAQLLRLIEMRHPSPAKPEETEPAVPAAKAQPVSTDARMERAREKLLTVMLAASARPKATEHDVQQSYEKLRDAALKGGGTRFVAALSQSLGISRETAWIIASDAVGQKLPMAFRAIGLSEEQAYLLTSALFPQRFPDAEHIAQFLESYRENSLDSASRQLDQWQGNSELKARQSV
ncbi:MAG: DUF2336 domain-containing protein [Rhizobiaceae bacterium]|nr:DUF2336 domain-containing protein [Rhizobiaceae bacterium]